MKRMILASQSPRRFELLQTLGVDFNVMPSGADEVMPASTAQPERVALRLARQKASVISERHREAVVLGADTIVVYRGRLLGKPATADEARSMLGLLRGRWHHVVTAVAVVNDRDVSVGHATTRVQMRHYSDEQVDEYVARGATFGMAGGYSIQDQTFAPVARWIGCHCNVVGLPLASCVELLQPAGVPTQVDRSRLPDQCGTCPLWERCGRDVASGG